MEIYDDWMSAPWRKMPGDERLAVIRRKAQLFDAAQSRFIRMGEAPVREIEKAALKHRHSDNRRGINPRNKGQRPFQSELLMPVKYNRIDEGRNADNSNASLRKR
jgi:hypothetical protein